MTAAPLAGRQTALYRLFDAKKTLLYVGISCDPNERIKDHAAEKPWWPSVRRGSITWLEDRASALHHEACVIAIEVPLYNESRPDPRRFDAFAPRPRRWTRLPGLSIGEAAQHFRVPPTELACLVAEGGVPHSRRRGRVWFSKTDLAAIEIRLGTQASAAMGEVLNEIAKPRGSQP